MYPYLSAAEPLFVVDTLRKSVPGPEKGITTHPRFRMKMAQSM
jgi:hypothetical protein